MAYRNYMEEVVVEELNGVLKQLKKACKCERCREDMVAYALNRLAPKYITTDLGNAYTKMNQLRAQTQADITVKLMEAAKIIKKKPRH